MGLERNLFTLLDRAARSPWADRPVFHFEGETRTYAELRERSLRLANGLLADRRQPRRPGLGPARQPA